VTDSPWLAIPVDDYAAHMASVGQSQVLREAFTRVYAMTRPESVLVLGCGEGEDFDLVTGEGVGVDFHPEAIARARRRHGFRFLEGDVRTLELDERFDLVHAALLFEYVDPLALFARIAGWLAPGGTCSTVTQDPAENAPAVSATPYASLRALEGHMTLHPDSRMAQWAAEAGLVRNTHVTLPLPGGKTFSLATYRAGTGT